MFFMLAVLSVAGAVTTSLFATGPLGDTAGTTVATTTTQMAEPPTETTAPPSTPTPTTAARQLSDSDLNREFLFAYRSEFGPALRDLGRDMDAGDAAFEADDFQAAADYYLSTSTAYYTCSKQARWPGRAARWASRLWMWHSSAGTRTRPSQVPHPRARRVTLEPRCFFGSAETQKATNRRSWQASDLTRLTAGELPRRQHRAIRGWPTLPSLLGWLGHRLIAMRRHPHGEAPPLVPPPPDTPVDADPADGVIGEGATLQRTEPAA